MNRSLYEINDVEALASEFSLVGRVRTLHELEFQGRIFKIRAFELGREAAPEVPVLMYVGGVHGLERIGSEILIAHLQSLSRAVRWDEQLGHALEKIRILAVPIVNPIGVYLGRRSNAQGIDLMRCAPVEADFSRPWLLHKGHRLSARLPWYRGPKGQVMPGEAQTLCDYVRQHVFPSKFALVVDVHSGFLGADRLWFPYARSQKLFPSAAEVLSFKRLLDVTYPNHRYVVEPQATHYTTHGDLWDYLYAEYRRSSFDGLLLPFTLELGVSAWLKKNPLQALSARGFYHPVNQKRLVRILRRHAFLLEFFVRATQSHRAWAELRPQQCALLAAEARVLWSP